MERQTLIFPAHIDGEIFRRFALFDTFRRQKRWRRPALFAAIFSACAAVCFLMREERRGAVLLGCVLLAVGLGLPAVYIASFLLSIRRRGKALDGARSAYTLHFREEGLLVLAGQQRAEYRWDQIFQACRARGCLYLYVSSRQAFLLPEDAHRQTERAWAFLEEHLPPEKRRELC